VQEIDKDDEVVLRLSLGTKIRFHWVCPPPTERETQSPRNKN
jgi:hypothetical protein